MHSTFRKFTVAKNKKLTFMYLANDVIQNSKKKGPEYGREFLKVLPKAFQHIGECCASDEKTNASLARILNIWEERGVYEAKICQDFRAAMRPQTQQKAATTSSASSSSSSTSAADAATKGILTDADTPTEDDWMTDGLTTSAVNGDGLKRKQAAGAAPREEKRSKSDDATETTLLDINGAVETHVVLQTSEPAGEFRIIQLDEHIFMNPIVCHPTRRSARTRGADQSAHRYREQCLERCAGARTNRQPAAGRQRGGNAGQTGGQRVGRSVGRTGTHKKNRNKHRQIVAWIVFCFRAPRSTKR